MPFCSRSVGVGSTHSWQGSPLATHMESPKAQWEFPVSSDSEGNMPSPSSSEPQEQRAEADCRRHSTESASSCRTETDCKSFADISRQERCATDSSSPHL